MHPLLKHTFGGLSAQAYVRHFIFGLMIPSLLLFFVLSGGKDVPVRLGLILGINTLLYPYARHAYETVVGYIVGDNVFFVNGIFMLFTKLFTMALCWGLAIFITPLGLIIIYFQNKSASEAD